MLFAKFWSPAHITQLRVSISPIGYIILFLPNYFHAIRYGKSHPVYVHHTRVFVIIISNDIICMIVAKKNIYHFPKGLA